MYAMHRLAVLQQHLTPAAAEEPAARLSPASHVMSPSALVVSESHSDFYRLNDLLSDKARLLRRTAREFAAMELSPLVNDFYERTEFPFLLLPKLAALHLVGLDVPARYGAPELSAVEAGVAAMEVAKIDAGLATLFSILQGISMSAIYKCGTEEQRRRWLPDMAALKKVGAFALTEPQGGSDAADLRTKCRRLENGDWEINGSKRWIGNGTFADVVIVWARGADTGEVCGFVVERGTPGMSTKKIEHKTALRSLQNADIFFDHVRVPESQRLPRCTSFSTGPGACLFLTRIMASWIACGIACGAYEAALQYVKGRSQFGKPLAAMQLTQEAIASMLGKVQAMVLMAWRVATLYDQKSVTYGMIGMLKAFVTRTCLEVCEAARNVMGGNGMVLDYGVAKHALDAFGVHVFEGSYEVNTLVAAREITGIGSFK